MKLKLSFSFRTFEVTELFKVNDIAQNCNIKKSNVCITTHSLYFFHFFYFVTIQYCKIVRFFRKH